MSKTRKGKPARSRFYFLFPRDEETEVRFVEMGFRPHQKLRRYGARVTEVIVYQSKEMLSLSEMVALKKSPHLNFLVLTCLRGDFALEYVKPRRLESPYLGRVKMRVTFVSV